ncbi:MAG: Alr-MurF fusion protein [Blastocatellia bacterium]|nr:Alr-MurF fusion protein [Blastocatellia bacterium]
MEDNIGRPTWAEIDLDALAENLRVIREQVGSDVNVMAAVKANAYGHGAVPCALRLESEGIDWFGVAMPEEGIELRQAGVTKPILCLGGFWAGQEADCLQQRLTPVVYRLDMIEALDSAARDADVIADVHVKIDTGMGRLGVRNDDVRAFCDSLSRFQNIRVDGLMTHLAAADDPAQEAFTNNQLKRFQQAITLFREKGFVPAFVHAANSAATFAYPQARGNIVRPGGTLYGFRRDVLPPEFETSQLRPVMSLRSRIMLLKLVGKGEKLGYGCTFETTRESRIATVPIGYDDGYRRALSNRGRVIVGGSFAPVVGRVSMDLTLIDVTDVPGVSLNDQVILLGSHGALSITAEDLAEAAGTISYEITSGISPRVPRTYLENRNET